MLGLAAVAAAALMAFVGAGTASATVICKTQMTEGCAASGWAYPAGTKGKASLAAGSSALLETTEGSVLVTCTGSVIESSLKNPGSATTTVESNVSTMNFTGCSQPVVVLKGGIRNSPPHRRNRQRHTHNSRNRSDSRHLRHHLYLWSRRRHGCRDHPRGEPGQHEPQRGLPQGRRQLHLPRRARFTGKYVATEPTNAWVAAS